jgi:hypothetical protein
MQDAPQPPGTGGVCVEPPDGSRATRGRRVSSSLADACECARQGATLEGAPPAQRVTLAGGARSVTLPGTAGGPAPGSYRKYHKLA